MRGGDISRRFPPHRALLEYLVSQIPLELVFGSVRQLFVVAEDDDAQPLKGAGDFICLDTDARVRAHPLDLLAGRRESVKMPFVVSDIDGHNIRLVIAGTPEFGKCKSRQRIKTLLIVHLVNEHCCLPLPHSDRYKDYTIGTGHQLTRVKHLDWNKSGRQSDRSCTAPQGGGWPWADSTSGRGNSVFG